MTQILVIVDQADLPNLLGDIDDVAPGAIVSVGRLVDARPAPLPTGYRQISNRR